MSFDYLQKHVVTSDDTSELTLYGLTLPNGKTPILIGRFAGEANRPLSNAVLKQDFKQKRRIQAGDVDVAMLEQNRDRDRVLYPKHVITGWRDVCDGDGKDVEFSPQECANFFEALPDDYFDDVRNHFALASNFRDAVDTEDAVDKGKT